MMDITPATLIDSALISEMQYLDLIMQKFSFDWGKENFKTGNPRVLILLTVCMNSTSCLKVESGRYYLAK